MPASFGDPTLLDSIGIWTQYQQSSSVTVYGPVSTQSTSWDVAMVTPTLLSGAPIDPGTQATQASTYRVIAAVAKLECDSYLDIMNGYDPAIISFGLAHWAMTDSHLDYGELFALLSYLKFKNPSGYQKYLGTFGIQPYYEWPAADMWNSSQRKYVNPPCICGLPVPPGSSVPAPDGFMVVPTADDFEHLRDWHWWYRFIMLCRTSTDLPGAMWDMARTRIRDLLATPWAAATGTGIPAPGGASATRPATFGEVFTSEHAVALLYRYHVNKPAAMVSGGYAGMSTTTALAQANISNSDTTTWTGATGNAVQSALVTQLRANPPGGVNGPADVGNKWDGWYDPTLGQANGTLLETAHSFQLYDANLPAAP
jgi:hypothetical protein